MGWCTSAAPTDFSTRWNKQHRFACRMAILRQFADVRSITSIKGALQSGTPIDSVQVQGWVRTRRDSKDFSFIELNDGSGLRNLQIIARDTLANYPAVQRLSTGASIIVSGALVPSQGKGQKWELVADKSRDHRTCRRFLPAAKEGTYARVSSRDCPSSASLKSFQQCFSRPEQACLCRSPVFSGPRFRLRAYANHYRQRLRGSWRIVSRYRP